jgi:hypothetical protein
VFFKEKLLYSRFSLFERKDAAKEAKKLAVLSLCQFKWIAKHHAPPRVEILLEPRKIYSEPRRSKVIYRLFM